MNYKNALRYLNSFHETKGRFDLEDAKILLRKTGIDPAKLNAIHVGGTNGKGSVTAMLSSALTENGLRVGAYTSPHIKTERERIRLNNKIISRKEFARIISWLKPFAEICKKKPSYFEAFTVAVFKYFLDKKVDFAVLEVGLGGRLDATNLADGSISIITNATKEHTNILGKTIPKIAREKAGIIKKGALAASLAKGSALREIRKIAGKRKAKLITPKYRLKKSTSKGVEIDLLAPFSGKSIKSGLVGAHQAENLALAATVLGLIDWLMIPLDNKKTRKGLRSAELKGRLEVVSRKPLVLFDVAHNPDAIKALLSSLKVFNYRKLHVVFACLARKEFREMLKIISKKKPRIIFTNAGSEDRAPAIDLANAYPCKSIVFEKPKDALKYATKTAGKKDLVLACGSHYLLSELS